MLTVAVGTTDAAAAGANADLDPGAAALVKVDSLIEHLRSQFNGRARIYHNCLFDRTCTNQTCHCHIGYVHLEYLELDKVFGSGILERIPAR